MADAFQTKIATWQMTVEFEVIPEAESRTFVERLVDDLHSAALGVKGTDLFFNQMPDTDESPCTMIRDMGGDSNVNPLPWVNVLFTVRARSWEAAREHAAMLYNHYHGATNKTITGYRIVAALAQGLPASMGEDENQRHRVGFSMLFRVHNTGQTAENVGFGGKRDPNEP